MFQKRGDADEDIESLGSEHLDRRIQIPTLHCWGQKDSTNAHNNVILANQCEPSTKTIYTHSFGHELPTSGPDVIEIVKLIRRTAST